MRGSSAECLSRRKSLRYPAEAFSHQLLKPRRSSATLESALSIQQETLRGQDHLGQCLCGHRGYGRLFAEMHFGDGSRIGSHGMDGARFRIFAEPDAYLAVILQIREMPSFDS